MRILAAMAPLVLSFALAACGTDAPGGSDADGSSKLTLDVPQTLTGTPRSLDVVVVDSVPPTSMPAGVLYHSTTVMPQAGASLTIEGDASSIAGDYYVVVALYMQGGGTVMPKSGVDYVAQSMQKFHFDGHTPVDLGTLTLAVAP